MDRPEADGPADPAEVDQLLASAAAGLGRPALSDHAELARRHRPPGTSALVERGTDGRPVAYAQLTPAHDSTSLEVVVAPGVPGAAELETRMVRRALAIHAGAGGGRLWYWLTGSDPGRRSAAEGLGFASGRELHLMTVGLPLGVTAPPPDGVALRAFRPGADEPAWLEVNNRAFADHPEQGGWDAAMLAERMAAPWFEPEGLIVAEAPDGTMAGSCWTKLHVGSDPLAGEIYVIAVDPAGQRRGLGRALTVAGLAHLAGRGARLGMLFVDAANGRAVALYRSLGFEVARTDTAMVVDAPAGAGSGGA